MSSRLPSSQDSIPLRMPSPQNPIEPASNAVRARSTSVSVAFEERQRLVQASSSTVLPSSQLSMSTASTPSPQYVVSVSTAWETPDEVLDPASQARSRALASKTIDSLDMFIIRVTGAWLAAARFWEVERRKKLNLQHRVMMQVAK